ncbi:hypothetical protein PHJA_000547900 [Phtheirospermum japonicum]|uniref:Sigma non-opioid intracellular receptor 1 n=1 Tax=Phtheirospermum japonicum TaxID=374723 RepID=A0A830BIY0_9LAMI|nr:hypothetical protein PHJA_000547900 [Phtheirospermum japonicum]
MKTVIFTPDSSVKSSTTMETNPSETRDSFYYPGCRKDANCNCDICIASINATLDLIPQSIHRSSLTNHSVSRPAIHRSPVSFASSIDLSTPKSSARTRPPENLLSPPLSPTEISRFGEKVKRRKRELGIGVSVVRFILGLILVCGVDFGVSWMVSRVLKARLSPGSVMNLGENSKGIEGLDGRFMFLKKGLEGFVGKQVSSCNSVDSAWKISQDGLLLNSRCVLYKSMSEEVSIWGWPLQTAGLLTAEHSFRSFSILSGRVTEWSNGEAYYFIRTSNHSSWTQGKWNSSVVQLDPNTWILEYKRSFFLENAKLFSTALDFLKLRLTRKFGKLKQEFWMPLAFASRYSARPSIPIPT